MGWWVGVGVGVWVSVQIKVWVWVLVSMAYSCLVELARTVYVHCI